LAATTDRAQILERLDPYTTNLDRLTDIIAETTDKYIIKDLILADYSYAPALERLLKTDPDLVAHISDATSTFRAKAIDDGGVYHPEGDALDRINALYDSSIKTAEHKKILRSSYESYRPFISWRRKRLFPNGTKVRC
jgi:hypothetical protein